MTGIISGEAITVSAGEARFISSDGIDQLLLLAKKDSSEFGGLVSTVPYTPMPASRIPFFPDQWPHFNSRHTMKLGIHFVL